jgi:hypothetical protein
MMRKTANLYLVLAAHALEGGPLLWRKAGCQLGEVLFLHRVLMPLHVLSFHTPLQNAKH